MKTDRTPTPAQAAIVAAASLVVPIAMSVSSTPSPNHPRIARWYENLRKPWFKPPDAVFPIAWTAIEGALALAAYRLLRAPPSTSRTRALRLWASNIVMIGGWSSLFFKRRDLASSTVEAAVLLATSSAFVRQAKNVDRIAARAGMPLVAWVTFATVLTASIWTLNRGR